MLYKNSDIPLDTVITQEAASIMRSWYLHPSFVSAGIYDSIYLGECAEYLFYYDLIRVIRSKLEQKKLPLAGKYSEHLINRPSLKEIRCCSISNNRKSIGLFNNEQNTANSIPSIFISVRAQNLAVLYALHLCRMYNLIIEGNLKILSDQLNKLSIIYKGFDSYYTIETQDIINNQFNMKLATWLDAIHSASFQEQFTVMGESIFNDIKESLIGLINKCFRNTMTYIEIIKGIVKKNKISGILIWNDSLPEHRAAALWGRQAGIPVLHIAHGIYGLNPQNEIIYADKVAVFGNFSKKEYIRRGNQPQKITVTGNPDWDKYRYLDKTLDINRIYSRFNLDPNKKTILLASFSSEDQALTEIFFRRLLRFIDNHGQRGALQVAVKLHPSEWYRKTWYEKIAIEEGFTNIPVSKYYLEGLLRISDLIIGRQSSNIEFEAFLLDKPMLLSQGESIYGNDLHGHVISDINTLGETINKILLNSPKQQLKKRIKNRQIFKYNYLNDGLATHRVLKIIEDMINSKIDIPDVFYESYMSLIFNDESEIDTGRSDFKQKVHQGDIAFAQKEYSKALTLFNEAEKLNRSSIALSKKICRALLMAEKFVEAGQRLQSVRSQCPADPEPLLMAALILFYQRHYERALKELLLIIEDSVFDTENKSKACYYAGRCFEALSDIPNATNYYKRSIDYDPTFNDSYKKLATLFSYNNEFDEAINILERLIIKHPEDSEAFNDLGVIFFQANDIAKSIDYLKRALNISPSYYDALFNLVEIERSRENIHTALKEVNKFLIINTKHNKAKLIQKRLKKQIEINKIRP